MNKIRLLYSGCIVLFFALCLLHFFSQRPLWLDEDFVFQNIVSHSAVELFGPLDPVQSFPRVFLAAIQAFAGIFDYHVLALRLPSLLAMLAAFLIWARLFKADSRDDLLALLALFAVCASYKFSYYAAELKPYSMDVLVVAVFTLYVHYQRVFESIRGSGIGVRGSRARLPAKPDARSTIPGIAPQGKDFFIVALLPLLIFFSYAGLFVFWIVAWNFLWQWRTNRKVWPLLLTNVIASAVCLGLFYGLDVRHSITQPGIDYWDGHFICYDSWHCFLDKFGDGTRRMIVYPFEGNLPLRYAASLFIPFAMIALFWYGGKRLFKDGFKLYHIESIGLLLYAELFVLGSLGFYPFTGERLTLFFSPFVIYMTVKGLGQMVQWSVGRRILLTYFGVFYLLCLIRTVLKLLHYYAVPG